MSEFLIVIINSVTLQAWLLRIDKKVLSLPEFLIKRNEV